MSPFSTWSRVAAGGLRMALVVTLLATALGASLPSNSVLDAVARRVAAQTGAEPPPGPDATEAPAGPLRPAERPPSRSQPTAVVAGPTQLDPVPAEVELAPVSSPEPWGPTRVALHGPALGQSVPAGDEATFVLEVAHLGLGGPDSKEIRYDAPAGWGISVTSAASGEAVFDDDGDGWVETRPLSANDWTYVAVTVTTPAGLTTISSAGVTVTASSAGADIDAFRSWIDLSVTAVVPEPTPEPPALAPRQPAVTGPSSEPSPSTGTTALSPSPGGSSDGSTSPLPSDDGQPGLADGVPMDTPAVPSGPDVPGSSPSASPSASPSPGQPIVVSLADDRPIGLVPGETASLQHVFALEGLAVNKEVRVRIAALMDPAWSSMEADGAIETPDGALLVDVNGSQRISVTVRIDVPQDAERGSVATLDISAAIVPADPVLTGASVALDPVETVDAGSRYALVVEAAASRPTLSVEGEVDFGLVRFDGLIDPSTTGVTSVADDIGATYTRNGAITVTVSGVTGPWSVFCGPTSEGVTGGVARFSWREPDGEWRPFPAGGGECLRGDGPAAMTIDIQYRAERGDLAGPTTIELSFTLHDTGMARSGQPVE